MIKFILAVLSLLTLPLSLPATHLAGGEISYRYIGDSTGYAYHYLVKLRLYRDKSMGSLGLSNSQTICIRGCSGSMQLILPQHQQNYDYQSPCLNYSDSLDSTYFPLSVYTYRSHIILPGPCTNYSFNYTICCRNNKADNIQSPDTLLFNISSSLNNINDSVQNNSPTFKYPGPAVFCLNLHNTAIWSHTAVDDEGDSLFYRFDFKQNSSGCNSPSYYRNLNFKYPYTALNPFHSASPIALNSTNGVIQFQPNIPQTMLVRVTVDEYRKNSFGNYFKIGQITRDVQGMILNYCRDRQQDWQVNFAPDSNLTPSLPACGDSTLMMYSSITFDPASLSANGSDFRLFNSAGQLLPIISARYLKPPPGMYPPLDGIELKVYPSFWYNDTLKLTLQPGQDGNTLMNPCGFEAPPGDTIKLVVSGCSSSVATREYEIASTELELYPNPAGNRLNVILPGPESGKYRLYDSRGILMKWGFFYQQEFAVDLSKLSPGLYYLQAVQKTSKFSSKFIRRK